MHSNLAQLRHISPATFQVVLLVRVLFPLLMFDNNKYKLYNNMKINNSCSEFNTPQTPMIINYLKQKNDI
jgi:hypothetical protein